MLGDSEGPRTHKDHGPHWTSLVSINLGYTRIVLALLCNTSTSLVVKIFADLSLKWTYLQDKYLFPTYSDSSPWTQHAKRAK